MATKLTLSINEKVIEKAKEISRLKGKSLSKIVEEYLSAISNKETQKTSSVQKLSGILKKKIPANIEIKAAKGNYLKKKYGI